MKPAAPIWSSYFAFAFWVAGIITGFMLGLWWAS